MQGVPYVWGGTSANGVDCSGYIYHVFKKFGHNISRQSVAGYWSSLPKTSSPQPGDLIYFQNTYKSEFLLTWVFTLGRIIYPSWR